MLFDIQELSWHCQEGDSLQQAGPVTQCTVSWAMVWETRAHSFLHLSQIAIRHSMTSTDHYKSEGSHNLSNTKHKHWPNQKKWLRIYPVNGSRRTTLPSMSPFFLLGGAYPDAHSQSGRAPAACPCSFSPSTVQWLRSCSIHPRDVYPFFQEGAQTQHGQQRPPRSWVGWCRLTHTAMSWLFSIWWQSDHIFTWILKAEMSGISSCSSRDKMSYF